MTPRVTVAIAVRVLTQLRRDHRTLAMLLVLPCLLQALLWWIFQDTPLVFDRIGPALLAIFPFFVMFLVTSITTLRERSGGTLERLFTMPMGRLDFLGGYALAFGAVAAVQAALAAGVAIGLLDLDLRGPDVLLVVVSPTRCSARPSGCSSLRSPGPSSRRCSSCRPWSCRRSCSAG